MTRNKAFFLVGFLSLLVFTPPVHAFSGCEEDCQSCHSLRREEASEILTKLNAPDAEISHIRISPVKGLWEVGVENKGKKGKVFVGFGKKHIVGGPILEIKTLSKKMQGKTGTQKPPERYIDVSKVSLDRALIMGREEAEHKVIVFTDPDCAYCSRLHGELKEIVSKRDDIVFYLKLYPLRFHKDAYWKAQSIVCNRSLVMLEDNFDKKPIPKPDCDTDEVDNTIQLAKEFGISGTPTIIMPNGHVVKGAQDAERIIELVLNPREKGEKE